MELYKKLREGVRALGEALPLPSLKLPVFAQKLVRYPQVWRYALFGLAALVFIYSSGMLIHYARASERAEQQHLAAKEAYYGIASAEQPAAVSLAPLSSPAPVPVPVAAVMLEEDVLTPIPAIEAEPDEEPEPPPAEPVIRERFNPLLEKNDDTVGWLRIDGTEIDYPVVQAEDNAYYLNRDLERREHFAGSIFMDYRNAIEVGAENRHWIIYGHRMRDTTQFTTLLYFREKEFFQEHRTIAFDSLYEDGVWEVFSAYFTDAATDDYIRTQFSSEAEWTEFAISVQQKSLFDAEVELKPDDRILTLSTCSYRSEQGRFVVHARLVKADLSTQ